MSNQVDESFKILSQMLLEKKGLKTINSNSQKGGFGLVLFVEDIQSKKKFAVKAQSIINQHTGQVDDNKLLFCKQESQILESVKHKNVVEYHSDYVIGFYHFLQMNLCEQSLDDWIQRRGNQMISQSMFFHFLQQILDGIEHLHSQNYVLRDLSIKNILITTDGVIKLCDFGLAQQIDKQSVLASQIQSYNPKGVFVYFPPELIQQIENSNQKFTQSKSGDIWAFGVCLSMLGGVSFIQASQFNQQDAVIRDASLLDQYCNSIIKYILNPNPKERPTIPQIRKYIYDHLNSQKSLKQMQEQQSSSQIQIFKNQFELEQYYNSRDLEIPVNDYKQIEKQCLQSQDKIESLLKLSQIYLNYTFEFEKAQQYALLSLEKNPQDPDVYLNQCDIYIMKYNLLQTKCSDQIEYFIERASKICPNYWRVYSMRTKIYFLQSKSKEAYVQNQKALELNKTNAEIIIRQYMCQIKDGDTENNKQVLKLMEEVQVKQKYLLYYQNLGFISDLAGEFDKSVQYYLKQISLVPTPISYNNLGSLYQYDFNDNQKAKQCYEKSLELAPYYLRAMKNLETLQNL